MNNDMSPSASPGELNPASGVRRVNNVPVYIFIGVVTIFIVVMVLVMFDQPDPKAVQPTEIALPEKSDPGLKIGGIGLTSEVREVPKAPPIGIEKAPVYTAAEQEVKPVTVLRPSLPPPSRPAPPPLPDPDAQRIAAMKQAQFEQAVNASSSVSINYGGSSGFGGIGLPNSLGGNSARSVSQMNSNDVQSRMNSIKEKMQQLNGMGAADGFAAKLGQLQKLTGAVANGSNQMALVNPNSSADRWKLNNTMDTPETIFQLRAGFVIPVVLISGINSEVPGQILGQVSQNVYDTPTGRHLLIPQGSRLVGSYQSNVQYGQSRMLVAWQRIVFPDGKALDIGNMPGSDSSGYAGLSDQVDNHYFRIFGSAILMSAITAGVNISQRDNSTQTTESSSDIMSQALGQQLGQVSADMIRKNLSIAPTLKIRPGYRFNVAVVKDLTFTKPYQNFDY